MPCTTLCLMTFHSGGSHANCECECHVGFDVPGYSPRDQVVDERNALRDEVAELKRKLAEVEGERDALREQVESLNLQRASDSININRCLALNGYVEVIEVNSPDKVNVAETLLQWNDANCNSQEPQEKAQ